MYNYLEEKSKLFTEEGQVMFLKVRDNAKKLLLVAGVFRMQEVLRKVGGDSWMEMACVDRLVELGEIREIKNRNPTGQYRIFVSDLNE